MLNAIRWTAISKKLEGYFDLLRKLVYKWNYKGGFGTCKTDIIPFLWTESYKTSSLYKIYK